MTRRIKRAVIRIAVYMVALFLAQYAFANAYDHTEAYVQNFMLTVMLAVEGSLIWWDNRYA